MRAAAPHVNHPFAQGLFDYLVFIISNITLCRPLVVTFRLGRSSVRLEDHNHRVIASPAKLARQQTRQGGSSIRKKVVLKALVLYIAVYQVVIVEQALTVFVTIQGGNCIDDSRVPGRHPRCLPALN